jgi:hypothetical protein
MFLCGCTAEPSTGNTLHFRKSARAEGGMSDAWEVGGGGERREYLLQSFEAPALLEALVRTQTKTSAADVVSFLQSWHLYS